ncbi:DNA repair protein [Marinobacter oulmenensis]|uniref:DNA repair protein n=1 Tax=Marinobacter oulmenensis TaxID=643747 RepID=UPI0031B59ED9
MRLDWGQGHRLAVALPLVPRIKTGRGAQSQAFEAWSSLMVEAGQAAEGHSAIFFMEGGGVARQMRLSEFGAFLDGYVGLTDLAETDVHAVLVNLGPDLGITSLVFFRIWFDDEGRADTHWNVPVESLAGKGAKGPDLGAGPIRLVCRSQCPDPDYASELWDPDMTPGSNHFQAIRKAVEANSLRFRKAEPAEEDIPTLKATPVAPEQDESGNRARVAQLLREQRLRIKTLQGAHREAMAELQREHRLEMQALRGQLTDLEQKHERLRIANEQIKQRLSRRNEQYLALQDKLADDDSQGRDDANAGAETVLLREQLERKQRELELREERIQSLESENRDLQQQEPAEGSLLEQLRDQAVFLVAYHPGVGHITLPYGELDTYFANPVAYAAERCGLNEPAYRQWLAHYEHPVCNHVDESGEACAEPILRITQPADFRAGGDDRCEQHQAR